MSSSELNHLIPLRAFSRVGAWCECENDALDELKDPIEDQPLTAGHLHYTAGS